MSESGSAEEDQYIEFKRKFIRTTVTSCGSNVTDWVRDITTDYPPHTNNIIVGLDLEWNPVTVTKRKKKEAEANPVATLHLCVGYKCLIVQLIHLNCIPRALKKLLNNMRFVFVGVDMESNVASLKEDYELVCRSYRDLAEVALGEGPVARRLSPCPGLRELAREVVGLQLNQPKKRVLLGEWGSETLADELIYYACINAFSICKIGKKLLRKELD